MSKDWLASFEALKSVFSDEAFSNIAINEAVEHHKGCSVGFVRSFTKGVIRDRIRLDYYIDKLAERGIKGIKNRTLIVIRMGLYAIDSLDSVPDYAAVNEAVALAKQVSRGSDRFVNAILRSYIRRREELKVGTDNLSVYYSFPEKLLNLIQEQYGDETEEIIKALHEPAPMVIRANLTKIGREELIDSLKKRGIDCRAADETESGIICSGGEVLSGDEFRQGLFSVQSLSSIIAIEKFHPADGSKVLDMCAAPGGKTCAMAELMKGTGDITACDVYEHRLGLIEASAKRLGITGVRTRIMDGTEHVEEFENAFDYVLADVPCSGLGVIGGKPEIKYRTEPENYQELVEIQKEILKNAVSYTKSGGILEYSTCTLNKNENEGVIKAVLNDCSLLQILEMTTILPYNSKVGFFCCIMQKNVKE